jgi:hypothetical protein
MTEDQKKEAVSRELIRMLAIGDGCKVIEPPLDHGVDQTVVPVTSRIEPSGRVRFLDSAYKLDFQLKATTQSGVIETEEDLKFDLDVKNFNDLVYRKDDFLPLHLILVILTAPVGECFELADDLARLHVRAYWYVPEDKALPSPNTSTVRITIPKANQLHSHFIRERFAHLGIAL